MNIKKVKEVIALYNAVQEVKTTLRKTDELEYLLDDDKEAAIDSIEFRLHELVTYEQYDIILSKYKAMVKDCLVQFKADVVDQVDILEKKIEEL